MHFTDWTSTSGREVVPGDLVWAVTGDELQVIRAEIAPGAAFALHSHSQEQIIVVLEGCLEFTVGSTTETVKAGGVIHAPAGVRHGGAVRGRERVVTIEAFHPPRRNFDGDLAVVHLAVPQ